MTIDMSKPQSPQPPVSAPPPPSQGGTAGQDERNLALIAHIGSIIGGFLVPLVIWLIKKGQAPFVEDQAKEALNFQITLLIGYIVAGILTVVVIGAFIMPVLMVAGVVLNIMAGIAASRGEFYRYPFTLRLIK